MNNPRVYFRADGNQTVGHGHVYRSLALAEMICNEYDCVFIIQQPSKEIASKINSICSNLIELDVTPWISEAEFIAKQYLTEKDIIVTDGYNFNTEYQSILKTSNTNLLCIDDIHTEHFVADAILNHAGGITTKEYSSEVYTQLFLGLKYALLSKEFRQAAANRSKKVNNDLFICLGGADPTNQLLHVLKQIEEHSNSLKCNIVIGSSYKNKSELESYLKKSALQATVQSNLSTTEMLQLMNNCSQAITSPSTISYEYLSTGGELYLHQTADNQKKIFAYLVENKIAFPFSEFPLKDNQLIEQALENQKSLFDGDQHKRILSIFKFLNLNIRKAKLEDCKLYHEWANDPTTRSQSFNQEPIPNSEHENWFHQKINSKSNLLFLILENNVPAGQIRFDINGNQAIINYSISKNYRGKRLSSPILLKGISEFKRERGNAYQIIGYVKKSNIASAKAFRSINFKEDIATEFEDSYKYTWQ